MKSFYEFSQLLNEGPTLIQRDDYESKSYTQRIQRIMGADPYQVAMIKGVVGLGLDRVPRHVKDEIVQRIKHEFGKEIADLRADSRDDTVELVDAAEFQDNPSYKADDFWKNPPRYVVLARMGQHDKISAKVNANGNIELIA